MIPTMSNDAERKKRLIAVLMLVVLVLFTVRCASDEDEEEGDENGDDETATETTVSAGPKYAPTGKEGTLTGTFKFEGDAPTQAKIQMEGDDFCAKANPNALSETTVVNGGKLQNVIIYVKEGLKNSFDPSPDPVVLDQHNCQYVPHVVATQVKQTLKIVTSDDTTHNVHPQPKNNKEWNKSQPPKGDPLLETFARAEVIPVKCNQHPWMKAYIGVFNHPFHAVTDKDGNYTIKGLPPGEYTIEAWHEKLGTSSQKVTIPEGGTATLDFSSGALKAEREGGLKLGAAFILSCCQPGHEMHK